MGAQKDELIEDIKKNLAELSAGLAVIMLILSLLFFKKLTPTPILIAVLGCVCIILLALEKRAESFDRIFAMGVITVLGIGFVLFS